MKRDENISKELRALLKKSIEGTITTDEQAYLMVMQRGFEEDEWDELVTQLVLELRQDREGSNREAPNQEVSYGSFTPRSFRVQNMFLKLGHVSLYLLVAGVVFMAIHKIRSFDPTLDLTYNCIQVETDGPLPLHEFTVLLSNGTQRQAIRSGMTGVMSQEQGVEVIRHQSGSFEVRLQKEVMPDTTMQPELIQFETPIRQQAQVLLPDGTLVLLNAGSTFTYQPVSRRGRNTAILCLTGEAWIQAPVELQVASNQGVVQAAAGSSFEVLADGHQTRLKLLEGAVAMQGKQSGGVFTLNQAGTELWVQTITDLNGVRKDMYSRGKSWLKTDVPIWARTIREYRNAPLQEFVRDLARWHGFGVERLNCIAPEKKVSVAVCYQSQPNDLLTVVKGENIRVEYDHHKFTFCPENQKTDPLPMVIPDYVSNRAGVDRWRL